MRHFILLLSGLLALSTLVRPAHAAASYDNCTGFITSVPTLISKPGTWCLKQDVATSITSGNAITVSGEDVVLDCNGFRLDGLGGGAGTEAIGVFATRKKTTLRNCLIRGFYRGAWLNGPGGRNLVEHNHFDENTHNALLVNGDDSTIRFNLITDTGGSMTGTSFTNNAYGIISDGSNDIMDNTVTGVLGGQAGRATVAGIITGALNDARLSSSIARNHVAGLVPGKGGAVLPVWISTDQTVSKAAPVAVRDNDVIAPGIATGGAFIFGIECDYWNTSGNEIRVRNNVINGVNSEIPGIEGCGDAGRNDITTIQ